MKLAIPHLLAISLIAGTLAPLPPAQAQTASEARPQPAEIGAKAEMASTGAELMTALGKLDADLAALERNYRNKSGEERAIIESQIRAKRKELSSLVGTLASHVEELKTAGQDHSAPERLMATLLPRVSGGLQRSIEQSMQRVVKLYEQRAAETGDALAALDQELLERADALDEHFTTLAEIYQIAEAQRLDTASLARFLERALVERVEHISGILRLLTQQRRELPKLPPAAGDDERKAHSTRLAALNDRIRAAATHMDVTLKLMETRGLDTAAYKQLLIQSTGEITQDIFETKVAAGLLEAWLEAARDWIAATGPRWAFKIAIFVLIIATFWFLSGIVRRVTRRVVTSARGNLSTLLQEQVVSMVGKLVVVLGLLVALSQFGIDLGPILAGLGIAGFILGFALQDTLPNFASGMMILAYRPYDVGDAVEAGGVTGTVRAMNLVSTTILTFDNQKLVVPNNKIWGGVIRNITAEPLRRVDMTFGIAYADDVDHAERVLQQIVSGHERVLADPAPVIRLHSLGESSVDFVVRPWTRTDDYWTVYWDITRAVKKHFDAEGITIPFPQHDVHLIPAPAARD